MTVLGQRPAGALDQAVVPTPPLRDKGNAMNLRSDASVDVHGHAAPEFLREAVEAATAAPSIHNTQPWLFRLSSDEASGAVELYADRSRSLDAIDRSGRQLEISCGVALFFLRIALRAVGFDATVTLLPDDDPDHLASVAVRRGSNPSAEEQALATAIPKRHSQRSAFEAREVAPELLNELRQAAETEGAWLALIYRRDDQLKLITLLSRADRELAHDPAYLEELRSWLRTDNSPDGIALDALPDHIERHTEVVIRDFNPSKIGEQPAELPEQPPVDEHPALAVLGTDSDRVVDHLAAGSALGRLLLHAEANGISASLLGQVVDLPGPRAQLRSELNLIGEPQTVLRLGYGRGTTEVTSGRRPLADMLLS